MRMSLFPLTSVILESFSQCVYTNTCMMNAAQSASLIVDIKFIEKLTLQDSVGHFMAIGGDLAHQKVIARIYFYSVTANLVLNLS